MMPKRIPIKVAKDVGIQHGLRQVILLAWDGETEHVVTWGRTSTDCEQAAIGGNKVKKALGWPESLQNAEPSRVKKLKERIVELEAEIAQLKETDHGP